MNTTELIISIVVTAVLASVLASAGADYAEVRWSPDGRYLSATVHPGGPGNIDNVMVVVVDVASGEQTVVGVGSGAEWRP